MFFLSPPGETCRDHQPKESVPPRLHSGPVMPSFLSHHTRSHGTGPKIWLPRIDSSPWLGELQDRTISHSSLISQAQYSVLSASNLVIQTSQWMPHVRGGKKSRKMHNISPRESHAFFLKLISSCLCGIFRGLASIPSLGKC